ACVWESFRNDQCAGQGAVPLAAASRCVRPGPRFAPHLVLIPDRRQCDYPGHDFFRKEGPAFRDHALRAPGTLGHAGLIRPGRLGMPRMMHDMARGPDDVFTPMLAVPGGVLPRLARFG